MVSLSSHPEPKYKFAYVRFVLLVCLLPWSVLMVVLKRLFGYFLVSKPVRWCWDNAANPNRRKIDTLDLEFPPSFLWGSATAAHQIEGECRNNNWWQWEQQGRIPNGHSSVYGADHWNRVKEDVKLMKDLSLNSYRFSVEWSKVEPQPGEFDQSVLKHYSDEINLLVKEGITPMITLHHFTQPIWFDQLGGWEDQDNLEYFYKFAQRVFDEYSDRVKLWCTFNEPTVFTLVGWLQGSFPPGKDQSVPLWTQISHALHVLQNMLLAHCEVYKRLKESRPEPNLQIGIVHNVFNTHPFRRWNPIDYIAAYVADVVQNDLVLTFFATGDFCFQIPLVGRSHRMHVQEAPHTLDFIGLNYYSHMFYKSHIIPEVTIDFNFPLLHIKLDDPIRAEAHPDDQEVGIMTDMEYPIYAEGFHNALHRVWNSVCVHPDRDNIPIYVTENGIADSDDSRRKLYIKRYLYAMSRAIKEGVDVRGYYYWTLMDNFEWAFGYDQRFGLYQVDLGPDGSGVTLDGKKAPFTRTLRPGAKYYRDVVRHFTSANRRGSIESLPDRPNSPMLFSLKRRNKK